MQKQNKDIEPIIIIIKFQLIHDEFFIQIFSKIILGGIKIKCHMHIYLIKRRKSFIIMIIKEYYFFDFDSLLLNNEVRNIFILAITQ